MPFNWFNRQQNQPKPASQPAESPPAEPEAPAEQPAEAPTVAEDYLNWAKTAMQNIQKRQAAQATPSTDAPAEPAVEPATAEHEDGSAAAEAAIAPPETPTDSPADPLPQTAAEPTAAGITTAETAEPETAEPETAEPETPEAGTVQPESAEAETPEAETVQPETAEPETPEAETPEAGTVQPETPEAETPEAETPEAETPEAETVETAGLESAAQMVGEAPADSPIGAASPVAEAEAAIAEEPVALAAAPAPFWARAEAERLERLERLKAEATAAEPEPVAAIAPPAATPEDIPEDLQLDEGFLWSARVLAAQGRRADQVDIEEITWLRRLRQGLDKTRRSLVNQLRAIVGQGPLNQDAVTEIESLLLQADVGIEATDYIIEALQSRIRQDALPPEQAIAYLKEILRGMLDRPYETYPASFAPEKDTLNIWLITGVNGAGKTTTIGKIAHVASKSGYRCLIGAADTFRAAAVQQVRVWGDRSNVEVIANPGKNTDPAAVVFDAISAAQSRNTELLLVDTAGRLQNKKNLMDELAKIRRIIDKKAPNARIESLLVLDSTLGQNGLRQAEVFSEAAQLSGVILTKLDGTAKGGIALAVVQQLGLPIRFIGAGEGIEDLRPFSSYEFVEALLSG